MDFFYLTSASSRRSLSKDIRLGLDGKIKIEDKERTIS